jgi:hypothetical protein
MAKLVMTYMFQCSAGNVGVDFCCRHTLLGIRCQVVMAAFVSSFEYIALQESGRANSDEGSPS